MKKNGFTLVEVVVSFILVSIVSVFLFQIVLTLKTIYLSANIKTTMLSKQGIMTQKIYNDINENDLISVIACSDNSPNCAQFVYSNGTKIFKIYKDDNNDTIISYDNYSIKLGEGSSIGTIEISSYISSFNIFVLKVPINNKLFSGDYGLDIVTKTNNGVVVSMTFSQNEI